MIIIVRVRKGQRFTLRNVNEVLLTPSGVVVTHTDRPPTPIQGFIERITREDDPT